MAVPFTSIDEDDRNQNGSSSQPQSTTTSATHRRQNGSSSQPQSTTTSATQTPLPSPIICNEHLVQVFYQALYSANLVLRTPSSASPSSPSCCFPHYNYHRGNVFFSRSNACLNHNNNHREQSPRTPASYGRSQQRRMDRNQNEVPRRRLNSSDEEDDEDVDADLRTDECPSPTSSSGSSSAPASPRSENFNFEEHYTNLAARERLREFPGQVPQNKKVGEKKSKADAVKAVKSESPKSKEQNFVWPTVVTAVVLAVGYISSR